MKTKLSLLSFILFSLLLVSNVEAQNKKMKVKVDPEFEQFWKEFQKDLKHKDKNAILSKCHDLIIYGSGGDAFYSYEKFSIKEFSSQFDEIIDFNDDFFKLKPKIFSESKQPKSIFNFTNGMGENGESDGKDWAGHINPGTIIHDVSFCFDIGCFTFYFSKFNDQYKLWGIVRGA